MTTLKEKLQGLNPQERRALLDSEWNSLLLKRLDQTDYSPKQMILLANAAKNVRQTNKDLDNATSYLAPISKDPVYVKLNEAIEHFDHAYKKKSYYTSIDYIVDVLKDRIKDMQSRKMKESTYTSFLMFKLPNSSTRLENLENAEWSAFSLMSTDRIGDF